MQLRALRLPSLVPLVAILAVSACADEDATAPALADPAQPVAPAAAVSADPVPGQPVSLLWQQVRTGRRMRWRLSASGGYTGSATELRNVPSPYSIAAVADFNKDGHPDLAWENPVTGGRSIWRMLGAYWPTHSSVLPTQPTDWRIAAAADFDRDGFDDLVWQNRTTGERKIWFMNGAAWDGRQAVLPIVPTYWDIAGAGDFDRDGSPDLVWQNTGSGERVIWLMDGPEWRWRQAVVRTVGTYWDIAAVGDVDGDGGPDLVWQHKVNGERVIWLMDGTAWRGRQVILPTVPPEWEIVGLMGISVVGPAPTATTGAATSPTGTAVTLNAQVNTNGLPAIAWFEYRKVGDPEFTPTPPRTLDGVNATVSVGERVEGLTPNVPYQYRVVSTNAAATSRGAEQTFTLVLAAPEVVTGEAKDLGNPSNGMTLQGTADPNGAATTAWFEWGTSSTLAGASSTPVQSIGAGTTPVAVSARVTSLTLGQVYYYRLVAQNAQGTTQGVIRSVFYGPPSALVYLSGVFVKPGYYVQVTWNTSPHATSYQIFRGGQFIHQVSQPPFNDRSFRVDIATTTTNEVRACNHLGCSAGVSVTTATEALPAPTEFTATPSPQGVALAWQDNSVGEGTFVVQKRVGTGPWAHVFTTAPNAESGTDTQVTAGTTYEYRVTAAVHGEHFPGNSFLRHSAPAFATATPYTGSGG
ncbi:MAG TPA: VCBS repeat-containing protein [Longimicrobiaceae bacterium]|nr:VCBS repeat-containing protein [Longimicrobiaceae bacterium]